jgi:ABC-type hemin transport system ATPase subunit
LTLIVGRDGSGKSNNLAPLSKRYSVIPSTVVTFSGEPEKTIPPETADQTEQTTSAVVRNLRRMNPPLYVRKIVLRLDARL